MIILLSIPGVLPWSEGAYTWQSKGKPACASAFNFLNTEVYIKFCGVQVELGLGTQGGDLFSGGEHISNSCSHLGPRLRLIGGKGLPHPQLLIPQVKIWLERFKDNSNQESNLLGGGGGPAGYLRKGFFPHLPQEFTKFRNWETEISLLRNSLLFLSWFVFIHILSPAPPLSSLPPHLLFLINKILIREGAFW